MDVNQVAVPRTDSSNGADLGDVPPSLPGSVEISDFHAIRETVHSMRLRRKILVAVMLLSLGLTAVAALQISTRSGTPKLLLEANLTQCLTADDTQGCGNDAILDELKSGTPPVSVLALLDSLYLQRQEMPLICHDAFHMVGHYIDVRTVPLVQYSKYMSRCWLGLLDGMVESVDYDKVTAVQEIQQMCQKLAGEVSSVGVSESAFRYCWHPTGHGLWRQFSSIPTGVNICNQAAPAGIDRFWCTQALLMAADNLIETHPLPEGTDAALAVIDSSCTTIAQRDIDSFGGCRISYLREMMGRAPQLIKPFLERCRTFTPTERELCQEAAADTTATVYVKGFETIESAMDKYCPLEELKAGCFFILIDMLTNSEGYSSDEARRTLEPVVRKILPSYLPELDAILSGRDRA